MPCCCLTQMSGGAILNRNGSLALTRVRFEGHYATVRHGLVLVCVSIS